MDQYIPSYRAKLVRKYGSRIPTTNEGILTGYYRPDLLPATEPTPRPKLVATAQTSEGTGTVLGTQYESGVTVENGSTGTVLGEGDTAKKDEPIGSAAIALHEVPGRGAKDQFYENADTANQLRCAYVELKFDHGYPAIPNGMPFWHKLDFEGGFAYASFQMFLEAGNEGPRELHSIAQSQELLQVASQQHGRNITSVELNFLLQEYFIIHYWYSRSKAYDLYRETALRHQRLKKQVRTEDRHFAIAETVLNKLAAYFDTPAFVEELTAKTALDALSKVVAIQRVSIGLPAAGPLGPTQQTEATSFEMIMRNVAQRQGTGATLGGGHGAGTSHTREMVDQVLMDPSTAQNLQEVIIRISSVTTGQPEVTERLFPGKPTKDGQLIDEATVIEAELREIGANTGE